MASTTFKFSEDLGNIKFYCGLDVHKHKFEAVVFGQEDSSHEYVKAECTAHCINDLFEMLKTDPEYQRRFGLDGVG